MLAPTNLGQSLFHKVIYIRWKDFTAEVLLNVNPLELIVAQTRSSDFVRCLWKSILS